MTEPGGGSDLASLKTTAVRDGDDWIINGSKTFITNGDSADLVSWRRAPARRRRPRASRCSPSTPRWTASAVGRKLDKVGQDESDTAELSFEDVRVRNDDLIGELDTGFIR